VLHAGALLGEDQEDIDYLSCFIRALTCHICRSRVLNCLSIGSRSLFVKKDNEDVLYILVMRDIV
jgi:hypothetical protein